MKLICYSFIIGNFLFFVLTLTSFDSLLKEDLSNSIVNEKKEYAHKSYTNEAITSSQVGIACQTVIAKIDSSIPASETDGSIKLCKDQELTLNGSGEFLTSITDPGAIYTWDLGDGRTLNGTTVTFSYATSGIYLVNLTVEDSNGCFSSNLINKNVKVAAAPDFSEMAATKDSICLGESTTITGIVSIIKCTPPVSGLVELPDGIGTSYKSCIPVDCFLTDQKLVSIADLISICLNIEHSYFGDINIKIISPDGKEASLVKYNELDTPSKYLGSPNQDGENGNVPGIGEDYCFSMDGAVILRSADVEPDKRGTVPNHSFKAGLYLPEESLTALIGSPLNGDWCIEVNDYIEGDDGNMFSWSLSFSDELLGFAPAIVSETWDASTTITSTSGKTITVTPTTLGKTCYTYRVLDDFGCEYTKEICIDVFDAPLSNAVSDIVICDDSTNDGLAEFNLESQNTTILGTQDPNDFKVTYHILQADADAGTNALASPYTSGNTTIYTRLENKNNSSCIDTSVNFKLVVDQLPVANTATVKKQCVIAGQLGVFDLSSYATEILGGQDANDFILSFHSSSLEAINNTSPIASPYTTGNTKVYVRLTNKLNTTCVDTSVSFDLEIYDIPVSNAVSDLVLCDDSTNDGLATFTLDDQNTIILGAQDANDFSVSYYSSQADADTGTNPLVSPYQSGNTTIYTRLENKNNGSCIDTSENFELVVNVLPVAKTPTDKKQCVIAGQQGIFDLDSYATEILGTQDASDFILSFHSSSLEAINNTTPISSPYTTGNTMVYVRLANKLNTTCVDTSVSFDLEIYDIPVSNAVSDLVLCDDSTNDGLATFNLESQNTTILGAQDANGFKLSYYNSQADADAGTNPLASLYTSGNTTIYTRLENKNNNSCVDTGENFELVVNVLPVANTATVKKQCVIAGQQGIFDLDSYATEILGTQDASDFILSFHSSSLEAINNTTPIASPYTTGNTTVYVRLANKMNTTCVDTSVSFDLEIYDIPVSNAISDLVLCDDSTNDGLAIFNLESQNTTILGAQDANDFSVSYYNSQADADTGTNPLVSPYQSGNTTIYTRLENKNNGSCIDTSVNFKLVVDQLPVANTATVKKQCVVAGQLGIFDLDSYATEILGTQDANDFILSFHSSSLEAINNTSPIASPYTTGNTTVYVRLVNKLNTTCVDTNVSFDLETYDIPVSNTLGPLELCDDSANDGLAEFTLEDQNVTILGTQDPNDFKVTYHSSQADADAGTNPLANPYQSGNTTIYTRLENKNNSSCVDTSVNFKLVVDQLPVANAVAVKKQCVVAGQLGIFDLSSYATEILGGQDANDFILSFHSSSLEAINNISPIASPYTTGNTTVYVRLANKVNTTCVDTSVSFDLEIYDIPVSNSLSDLVLCDDSTNDGLATFNLESQNTTILGAQDANDFSVSYYNSQADADAGTDALVSPYQSGNTTIYTRLENKNNSSCVDTSINFKLVVDQLPVANTPEDISVCIASGSGNTAVFDLDAKTDEVLGAQNPINFNVSYHKTEADAIANTSAILNPYSSTNATVYVRLENKNNNSCADTSVSFKLVINQMPVVNLISDVIICHDLDTSINFDLSEQNEEILGAQEEVNFSVVYYHSESNAQLDKEAITHYRKATSGTVYYKIKNNITDCYSISSFNMKIYENPRAILAKEYVYCTSIGALEELAIPELVIDLSEDKYTFQWSFEDEEMDDEITSSIFPISGGEYSVVVTNKETLCTSFAATNVIVSTPPQIEIEIASEVFAKTPFVRIITTGEGIYEYKLDNGDWQDSDTFTNVQGGEHLLSARDINGCGMVTELVTLIDFPLFFTPNGDGNNETWNIRGIGEEYKAEVTIFDRYGKRIYALTPKDIGWDGTFNGRILPAADYWFSISYINPSDNVRKLFKGHFALKR